MQKTYQVAIYLRLLREDGDITDGGKQVSKSTANQKELVMDFLKSHPEIHVVSTYVHASTAMRIMDGKIILWSYLVHLMLTKERIEKHFAPGS